MNEVGYSEEHEAYLREHEDIQPDEDYEMNLSDSDRKTLWALANNMCALCKCILVQREKSDAIIINIGDECHINTFKPDQQLRELSRYNPDLPDDERESYNNAILLCSNCHKKIDNRKGKKYTVNYLYELKDKHEAWVDFIKEHPDKFKKEEEGHKEKLMQQIQFMQRELPQKIEDVEYTGFADKFIVFDTLFIRDIDNLPLFKDSTFSYDCIDIKTAWNDFKNSVDTYSSEKQILYNIIKKYIIQKLNQDFNTESEIKEGFYLSVYREILVRAKGEISLYDYFHEPRPLQYGAETKHQLKYLQKAEPQKDGSIFFLPDIPYTLVETSISSKRESVVSIHDKIIKERTIQSWDYAGIYRIITIQNEAVEKKKILDTLLSKFVPSLPLPKVTNYYNPYAGV